MTEKYTLNWHTFSEHVQLMYKDLYQDGRYTDVTLVSDDQTQFKAHKVVLSACSPVFKNIIDSNPSQNPLIYLRGVQSYEVESILQFMYLGEGRFYHERMVEFIKVAQDLEVKEISDSMEMGSGEEETVEEDVTEEEIEETLEDESENQENETKPRPRQPRTQISNDTKSSQCPECGTGFSTKSNMIMHYRSKHEGIRYPCHQCDYQARARGDLRKHIQSQHEGIRYPCDQCDYQATKQCNLRIHIQSQHEGRRYPCNQCDYQATDRSNLQKHIQSQHERIRYPCNQCDYQATRQSHLQSHISAKHIDTVLKCDSCDYQTKQISHYYKHKKTHVSVE